jgi:hypothetical protein
MEHPDVIQLENKLNKVWEDRDTEAQREAMKKEYDVNEDIPASMFYCNKCKKDYFPKRIVKVEQEDWNTHGIFRFWRSKHCGVWNVRLISQKVNDKFFIKSPSVCRDRRVNKLDLLQPNETGFDMLYKHKQNV